MNRHIRRAAKAMARHQIVAVHEAGHAVAKALAAADFGYEVHEAVAYIDVGSQGPSWLASDGQMILHSQGVTCGPTFSKEIWLAAAEFKAAFLADRAPLTVQGNDSREFFCGILNAGRTAGADIKRWFRIRAFDAVAGCIAEAIISKRGFGKLFWQDYSAEGDRRGIAHDAVMAAIPASEAGLVISHMAAVNAYLMQDDKIWAAVLALAEELPLVGRMPGREAVKIITGILSPNDLGAAYREAVKEIDKPKGGDRGPADFHRHFCRPIDNPGEGQRSSFGQRIGNRAAIRVQAAGVCRGP
jgi:hypothetical protein